MDTWPVQDAKARFSELLNRCLAEGPQVVTWRGTAVAVLVAMSEWRTLQAMARPSLKQLLLAPHARTAIRVSKRDTARRRRAPVVDQ
jgi:antitoxin Phd